MNANQLINAKLIGKTKYARFRDKFNTEWNKPNAEMLKAQAWREINPLIKEELARRIPQAVRNLNKRYGG